LKPFHFFSHLAVINLAWGAAVAQGKRDEKINENKKFRRSLHSPATFVLAKAVAQQKGDGKIN
jgi:hypothetical protein